VQMGQQPDESRQPDDALLRGYAPRGVVRSKSERHPQGADGHPHPQGIGQRDRDVDLSDKLPATLRVF
jgi:hypothetical protein